MVSGRSKSVATLLDRASGRPGFNMFGNFTETANVVMSCFPRRTSYENSSRFGHSIGFDPGWSVIHAGVRDGRWQRWWHHSGKEMQEGLCGEEWKVREGAKRSLAG